MKVIGTMNCKVCKVATSRRIRCGALVCEACKRFFMRLKRQHPNGEGIKCKRGDDQCLTEGKVKVTQKGCLWRGMCAACRFKKCVQVGMQYRGRSIPEPTAASHLAFNSQWRSEHSPVESLSISNVSMGEDSVFENNNQDSFPSVANDYKWLIEFCEEMKRQKEMEHIQNQENQRRQLILNFLANSCARFL